MFSFLSEEKMHLVKITNLYAFGKWEATVAIRINIKDLSGFVKRINILVFPKTAPNTYKDDWDIVSVKTVAKRNTQFNEDGFVLMSPPKQIALYD